MTAVFKFCGKCGHETERTNGGVCKPCQRAYNFAYSTANKDKLRAKQAAYRAANLEKIRAKDAAYCAANRERARARAAAWYAANPEKIAAYRAANRDKIRAANIMFALDGNRSGGKAPRCKPCLSDASTASRYGLTPQQLAEFRSLHGNKCGICDGTETLYVDHDHSTGKLRGLLCPSCNSAIGQLREDPALFASALAYLEKNRG